MSSSGGDLPASRPEAESDLFYQALIDGYIREAGYIRRAWLEDEISDRLERPDCRYVLLVGEPGSGKSGAMAGLAAGHDDWLRYFIRLDSVTAESGTDATSALLRLGHQFATCRPDLFEPSRLEVVIKQRVETAGPGSSVTGVRIEDLTVSPFHRTAIRVQQQVGVLSGRLVGAEVAHATVEPRLLEPATLQYLALYDPAALDPAARITIVIDALDEADRAVGGTTILDWLLRSPLPPPNVRFVLSTRPTNWAKQFAGSKGPALEVMTLQEQDDRVTADTRAFAEQLLARPELEGSVDDPDAAATSLSRTARGNFAYLRAYERALLSARSSGNPLGAALLDLERLPVGLGALYAVFLRSIRDDVSQLGALEIEHPAGPFDAVTPAWEGAGQRMLGILSVARSPLTLDQMIRLGGVRVWRSAASNVLQRFVPFLDEVGGAWRLFHQSVGEFLVKDAAAEAPDLGLDGAEWHERIVRVYRSAASWDDVNWGSVDDYGLLHLGEHLVALGRGEELAALVNQGMRVASRQRFLTDLQFQRLTEAAQNATSESGGIGARLASSVFLGLVRAQLSEAGRALAPAVFGLMARLGLVDEALARADLLLPGDHQFACLTAIIECAAEEDFPKIGGHRGRDRLVAAALEIPVADQSLFAGLTRQRALEEAAKAIAPYDVDRAVSLAAGAVRPGLPNTRDDVIELAALTQSADDALDLIKTMTAGRAAAATASALRLDGDNRNRMLEAAEQWLDGDPPAKALRALAGLVAGWRGTQPDRAAGAAARLRSLIANLGEISDSWAFGKVVVDAAETLCQADPELAAEVLSFVVNAGDNASLSWSRIRAVSALARIDTKQARELAEEILAYERGLGWYGPAPEIAQVAVAVDAFDPEWASSLADEATTLIESAATNSADPFDRDRLDLKLGSTVSAFRTWDRERALRLARLMGGNWVSGGSWDSIDGRPNALALLGLDVAAEDPEVARDLLSQCLPEEETPVFGRFDSTVVRGGLFRPVDPEAGDSMTQRVFFVTYMANAINYWLDGRSWRTWAEPADVARSVRMAPGTRGSISSWASVVAESIIPVASVDADLAIQLAGWPTDPCERLIASAHLYRALNSMGDDREAAALAAVGRAAMEMPRYESEVDLAPVAQRPVLQYLDPSVRARFEAALVLPPAAQRVGDQLTTACDSWYLKAALAANRTFHSLLFGSFEGATPEQTVAGCRDLIAGLGEPDELLVDMVRLGAVAAILGVAVDAPLQGLIDGIRTPGMALAARVLHACALEDGGAGGADAHAKEQEAAGKQVSAQQRAYACSLALQALGDLVGGEASQRIVDYGVAVLGPAPAHEAVTGLALIAAQLDPVRQVELLRMALSRADEPTNPYLLVEAVADLFPVSLASGDASIIMAASSRLLGLGLPALMEGLRRGIPALVDLAGPAVIGQIDDALWSAQRVLSPLGTPPPSHIDAIAAKDLRRDVLAAHPRARRSTLDPAAVYLDAADLPGMQPVQDSRGQPPDPGDYAYAACEGSHSGFMVWMGEPTDPIWRIVDIRWVFPDPSWAERYHWETLFANSEGNPPAAEFTPVGENCRVFGGTTQVAPDVSVTMWFYLFWVENVVVKLFAAAGREAPATVSPDQLVPAATRIVERIHAAA